MNEEIKEVRKTPAFDRWLGRLSDKHAKARILVRIARLEDGVWGDVRSLGEAVYEFRIMCGPGYRLYATMLKGRIVLLICGGDKASQERDIAKARRYTKQIRMEEVRDEKSL